VIYLVLKIFVYLLFALAAGVGAGWVLRHLAAARQEEEMQRTLADARARVPQFESLIRSRDEQINRLKEDLKEKDVRINALVDEARQSETELKEKNREARQLAARNQALELTDDESSTSDNPAVIDDTTLDLGESSSSSEDAAGFKVEVTRLERELTHARAQAADAIAEAATAEAEIVTLRAELDRAGSGEADDRSREEILELEARLKQKAEEFDRLNKELESEQRRVVELERERELQNKSLQVLHQQLELERERGQRVANG